MLTISADSLASHKSFADKLGGVPFPMLSDRDREAIALYDVLNEKGTGARRALFVVDKQGMVRHANSKYELSKTAQYESALKALQESD